MPIKTSIVSATQDGAIALAVEELLRGEAIGLPTETVYGLAADAQCEIAIEKIYTIKGRPSYNPLICHVSDPEMAARYVEISVTARKLMDIFWPGPLTIVCAQKPECKIANAVSANLDTLAVRCPANTTTRAIIAALDRPIAAPSANLSGKLSPTTAESVYKSLSGRIPFVIDDGQTSVGIESTIVAVDGEKITLLRPGSVSAEEICKAVTLPVHDRDTSIITAPGQISSHYAPNADILLNCDHPNGHVMVGFAGTEGDKDLNLSRAGDLTEAAHNLFEFLRLADARADDAIAIAPIPNTGVGIAINDRLKRAAAPRTSDNQETPND